MKKNLLTILTGLMAIAVQAQENPAYRIFTGEGDEVDYTTMLKTVSKADVVFIGETHNCPIAHWIEYEVISDIARKSPDGLVVGAEMLESDNQLLVDEYVSGLISSDRFESEAKLWDNHYTDYAPLLYLARDKGLRFVATNVPRRYASYVKDNGLDALNALSDAAKVLMAPLPIAYDEASEDNGMFAFMNMMAGHDSQSYYAEAQALKDATMAWFIAENFDRKFIHVNGNFHSDNNGGIIPYLNIYLPDKHIATICCVRQEEITHLDKENQYRADFIVCVPEEMTMTF